VRVWALHIGASGEYEELRTVDAPVRRRGTTVAWKAWPASRWQTAATALGLPVEQAGCVRVRAFPSVGRAYWQLVWGTGAPLAGSAPAPLAYVYVPGDVNRFVPLQQLRALCDSQLEECGSTLRLGWSEARQELARQLQASPGLAAAAAAALGLPERSPASELLAALDGDTAPPPPPPPPAAAAPAAQPLPPLVSAAVAAARANRVAALLPPGPAPGFEEEDDDFEDDFEEEEEEEGRDAFGPARSSGSAWRVLSDARSSASAQAAQRALSELSAWEPQPGSFAGLSCAELLSEKGSSFSFLSLEERAQLTRQRAAVSGSPISEAQAAGWNRAAWERAGDQLGLLFLDAAWHSPLRRLPPGWHAAWAPDKKGWALYVAAPSSKGTRFFSLAGLKAVTRHRLPAGLPPWADLLAALRDAAQGSAALATSLRAELRAMDDAAERAQAPSSGDWDAPPQPARALRARPPPRATAAAMPAQQASLEAPALGPALGSAAGEWDSADAAPAGSSPALPGKSPADLYLSLGLGFAFMKLGGAEARRVVRAAAAAAGSPLPPAAAAWDRQQWTAASEQLQLAWLQEGQHSAPLPQLGRGVRAAWGAGRVYLYMPAPADRFLQTTELRAGFCDALLRPPGLERGQPFTAWSRVVDALAEGAQGNPQLRQALLRDSVFPRELLPPLEEGEQEEGLADGGGDPGAGHPQPQQPQQQPSAWLTPEVSQLDSLGAFADADPMFAQPAAPERARVNYAPGGLALPRARMLTQPWREDGYVDEVLERLSQGQLSAEEHQQRRGWPVCAELEAQGVVLNDTHFAILRLHSFDLFVRRTAEGLIDLREAYGVDKEGTLDGISEQWSYTQTVWTASEAVPAELQPADYHPVDWTRRPTLSGSRGDRRRGEISHLIDWAEETLRVFLIPCGSDLSVPHAQRQLDFRTAFCVDDKSGMVTQVPVVGLLRPRPLPAGAPESKVELEETWDLPFDAHLCISWDYLYMATPDQMESSEDLSFEWLKRNRWKLQPDGSMVGTPLRMELGEEEVQRLVAEKREDAANIYVSASDLAARQAEAQEAREALEQQDREALSGEENDAPEVDQQ